MLKHFLIDLQIYTCINVQLYKCTFVKIFELKMLLRHIVLYKCTQLQMFKSINVHMANCIMNKCIMYKCIMNKCIMYKCIMYKCIMYKCIMCKSIMTFFIVGAGTVQRRRRPGILSDHLDLKMLAVGPLGPQYCKFFAWYELGR